MKHKNHPIWIVMLLLAILGVLFAISNQLSRVYDALDYATGELQLIRQSLE